MVIFASYEKRNRFRGRDLFVSKTASNVFLPREAPSQEINPWAVCKKSCEKTQKLDLKKPLVKEEDDAESLGVEFPELQFFSFFHQKLEKD